MPRMTVLDMVQDILSEMDSDEANSINDTVEAYQIARIIKNSYYEMISAKGYKYFDRVKALDSIADGSKPNYLKLPEDVVSIDWIRYNDEEIHYKTPEDFLIEVKGFNTDQVTITDFSGIDYKIQTNRDPKYWTSFDEEHIVFDAYDNTSESTLQSSNSQSKVFVEPVFTISDTFIPDIPLSMFPQLLAESKSTSFSHIKQLPSQKAEQKANRQRRRVSTQSRLNNGIKYPNYGRK